MSFTYKNFIFLSTFFIISQNESIACDSPIFAKIVSLKKAYTETGDVGKASSIVNGANPMLFTAVSNRCARKVQEITGTFNYIEYAKHGQIYIEAAYIMAAIKGYKDILNSFSKPGSVFGTWQFIPQWTSLAIAYKLSEDDVKAEIIKHAKNKQDKQNLEKFQDDPDLAQRVQTAQENLVKFMRSKQRDVTDSTPLVWNIVNKSTAGGVTFNEFREATLEFCSNFISALT